MIAARATISLSFSRGVRFISVSGVRRLLTRPHIRHTERAGIRGVRLRFERDGSRKQYADGDQSWTVEAALDLGAVGALHARVTLNGHRIGVQLRAESPAVVDTLSARRTELEGMLRESGLEVDRIVCLHGMPAGDSGPRPTRLLDIRA